MLKCRNNIFLALINFKQTMRFRVCNGKYWIRRIKYISTVPIVDGCLDAGYPQVQSQNNIANQTNVESIIEFPCQAPWLEYVDEERL